MERAQQPCETRGEFGQVSERNRVYSQYVVALVFQRRKASFLLHAFALAAKCRVGTISTLSCLIGAERGSHSRMAMGMKNNNNKQSPTRIFSR